jgi:hypothetical protein
LETVLAGSGKGGTPKKSFVGIFKRWETPVFLVYAGVAVLFTYPAITLFSRTYAEPRDPLGVLWGLWWLKYAPAHHIPTSPMTLINVPFFRNPSKYSVDPLTQLTLRAVSAVSNETVAYNIFLLVSFFLAGVCMYYLVRYLTRSPAAAAFSGLAFAFCPFMLAQGKEHINLIATFWIPLFVLALIKGWWRRTYGSILFCAVVYVVLMLFSFQFALFCGVFAVTFLMALWIAGSPWRRLGRPGGKIWPKILLLAGSLVITAALVLLASRSLFHFKNPMTHLYLYSGRPWDYVIPHADGLLFGGLTRDYILSHIHGGFTVESTLFLGFTPMVLSVIGIAGTLRRRRPTGATGETDGSRSSTVQTENPAPAGPDESGRARRGTSEERPGSEETRRLVWAFIFSGIVAFIFSMPPTSRLLGIKLYMPSYFLFKVVPQFRAYARFGIMVMMCVAVLAGYGIAFLTRRGRLRQHRAVLVAILMAVVLLEFCIVPPFYSIDTQTTADYYRWLKDQPGKPVAAIYPVFEGNDFYNYGYLFQQRLHHQKLINGSALDDPSDIYRWAILDITDPGTPGLLKIRGADYVMAIPSLYSKPAFHTNYVFPTVFDESRIATGLTLIRRFDDCLVYKVTAPPADFVTLFKRGSYSPYSDPEGRFWYPGTRTVTVEIDSKLEQPVTCDIKLKVRSARRPGNVTFSVNGKFQRSLEAPVWPVELTLQDITLAPGKNSMEINTDAEPDRLSDVPMHSNVVANMMLSNVQVVRR